MSTVRTKCRPDGTAYFQGIVRVKGHPPQFASFERKTDANRWAEQTEAAIRQRRHFHVFEAQRHTAAETIDKFVADVLPSRPKQRRDLISHLAWWRAKIGSFVLSEVTPLILSEARDALLRSTSLRTSWRR